jgi:histone H3/H4
MPKTQAEILDDNHASFALGGEMVPLNSDSESKLSQTRRAERIRARSELLARVLRPEPVRRMVRRAGISSYATSSPANENVDIVLKTLQQIADVILFNVCHETVRICEYLRRRTVTEELLGEALKTFGVKLHGACDETHKSCPTLKHRNAGAAAAHVLKGAESEISHEFDNESCVYFAYAPFVKLLRSYLAEQTEHPPKMTRGVISCVQFEMEKTLVEVLQKARYVVRQATKGKNNSSPPAGRQLIRATSN